MLDISPRPRPPAFLRVARVLAVFLVGAVVLLPPAASARPSQRALDADPSGGNPVAAAGSAPVAASQGTTPPPASRTGAPAVPISNPAAAAPGPYAAASATVSRLSVRGARASDDPDGLWHGEKFVYQADGKRLTEVLQDFAASQGIPAVIADGVEGVVHAEFNTSPAGFLKAISKSFGVIWYHDGSTLYFYPARAMTSRLFRLNGYTRAHVEDMLSSLHLGDRRFPLRYNEREHTLLAYGPPRHIDLVAAALESLDQGVSEHNRVTVRVFPLRFASAGDRTLGDFAIPGVVSTLKSLYGGSRGTVATAPRTSVAGGLAAKLSSGPGYGQAKPVPELEGRADPGNNALAREKSTTGVPARGVRSPVGDEEDAPDFEADEGNNAVIVRAHLNHMAEYAYLIQRMDVRPVLVELEAMIIDVNTDKISSLGIDWSVNGPKGSIALSSTRPSSTDPAGGLLTGSSYTVSTLWANAGAQLLSRIDLLAAKGEARVIGKPKVLGVANRPAVMQEKRIASVRVQSISDAKLFQVEAGTLLQVTPQVTQFDPSPQLKLSIYIEDGNFEAASVDAVPVIKRTVIRTEAHMVEGESLLIGGITVESTSTDGGGVPGISRIPLLGALFKWDNARSTRSERLFLITPKLIRDIDRVPPGDYQPAPQPVEGSADIAHP